MGSCLLEQSATDRNNHAKIVLLLLGKKQRYLFPRVITLLTLRILLIAIIRCLQLNNFGRHVDSDPGGGLLVIDAVG